MLLFLLEVFDCLHLIRFLLHGLGVPYGVFLAGGPKSNGAGPRLHEPTDQSGW
jgi:hypothetical protein